MFFLVWYLCACGSLSCFARKFAHPTSYIFCVERHGPNNSSPWIISDAYCCRPVIFLCSISGTSLSGSTVSLLLLSFTLNQASASSNHSIVPSRGNGKFTCLGWFVRGCFWAWLYWSGSWIYDSWNGLSSSHTQKGSSLLFLGGKHLGYGACLSFPFMIPILSWAVLCSLGSWVFPTFDPQLIMLKTLWFYLLLSYTSLWKFDLQMIAWDTPYHQLSISQHSTPCPHRLGGEYFREKRSFSGLIFPLTKGLRHIAEIPPFFLFSFLKKMILVTLGGSDMLEQNFLTDGYLHRLFCTPSMKAARPYGWTWSAVVHHGIFHLYLFSFTLRLAGHFSSSPSRFDSMTSSAIFG